MKIAPHTIPSGLDNLLFDLRTMVDGHKLCAYTVREHAEVLQEAIHNYRQMEDTILRQEKEIKTLRATLRERQS